MLRLYLYARVRIYLHLAHETAGAASTRHSLLPLVGRERLLSKPRTHRAARTRNYIHRHCEERMRRSNPCLRKRRDGLLRFARNDGVWHWTQTRVLAAHCARGFVDLPVRLICRRLLPEIVLARGANQFAANEILDRGVGQSEASHGSVKSIGSQSFCDQF